MEMTLEDTKNDLQFHERFVGEGEDSDQESANSSELGIDSLTLLNGILV